jgi:uncharacterized protein
MKRTRRGSRFVFVLYNFTEKGVKPMTIPAKLSKEFNLPRALTEAVIALIEEGNTIPFIARYRKEATGGMDDVSLRAFDERLSYLKGLEARKEEVIRLIEEQGKLTEALRADIESAEILQRVEDLYKPFKKKRATRASKARDAGLEPLAALILEQKLTTGDPLESAAPYVQAESPYDTPEAALGGACDIIAERIADDPELTGTLRDMTRKLGIISSEAVNPDEKTVYEMYYNFTEPAAKILNHRILAVNRGEKEEKLKVKLLVEQDKLTDYVERRIIQRPSLFTELLKSTIIDSYKRLMAPSLERDIRNELTERAEKDAIEVFAKNTENLLNTPPVKGARVIAIDPGYRTGCKVAVLSETGKLLDYTTIYPTAPRNDVAGTERTLQKLAEKYQINVIVIGNGTASRETEEAVAGWIKKSGLSVKSTIVNEAGASVYSASKLASAEYPDLDVTTRGAMSLGRRLQDPLAELVKIPPKSIGVGQYQHDINQSALEKSLTGVVENVVNRVGVDLNTASASLLGYVSGINAAVAGNIVSYREENGSFTDRKQLKKVPKLGEKAFKQCAGFLRIRGAKNPLDGTAVHPESYAAAAEILKRAGVSHKELATGGVADIEKRVGDAKKLAEELGVGLPTLRDILAEIKKPGRDPREDAPPVIFNRAVRAIEDLTVGMQLSGTVRNVVDFGAFVDIGVKQDGLVHISRMSDRFIRHPSEVAAVGDTVTVWVTAVDKEKGKIGLSMVREKNGF